MAKYALIEVFSVDGNGSFEDPIRTSGGGDMRVFPYILRALGLQKAFVMFGSWLSKAFARYDDDNARWMVSALEDKMQVSEDQAAEFLDRGFGCYFAVRPLPETVANEKELVILTVRELRELLDAAEGADRMAADANLQGMTDAERKLIAGLRERCVV